MMRSLRWRLIAGTTLVSLAVYAAAAVVLYGAIRESLLGEFDRTVIGKARVLATSTEEKKKEVRIELDEGEMPEYGAGQQGEAYILWGHDGKIIVRSESWPKAVWPKPESRPVGTTEYAFLTLPDGGRARGVCFSFMPRWAEDKRAEPAARPAVTLLVVRDAGGLDSKMQQLAWLLAGVFSLTTLVTAGLMAWVVGRGLKPLGALAAGIQGIGEDELSKRVKLSAAPVEMRPVVERLNELLERVEASFTRERAFTADVAHELRTPLAGLTTALEVCSTQRRSAEEYERIVGKCLKVSRGMRGLVENLLTLARADAHELKPANETVDVSALLRDLWREFELSAAGKRLEVAWSVPEELEIQGDRGLMMVVLRNLVDNAVTYADEGGSIRISGSQENGEAIIGIANSGSQVASEDARRVFDRFWRGDAARNVTGQHCGLGLALCQRIVTLLGGKIVVETAAGGEFEVIVRAPAGAPQASAA